MSSAARIRYRFGGFEIDDVARVLERDGEAVPVSRKATEALLLLIERAGGVVTKEELFERVWPDVVVDENNLSQCISALRRAVGDDSARPRFVATVPRRGFRFVAPVEAGEVSEAERGERPPVVAVLPFRVDPPESPLSALGEGLAEELTTRLAAEPGVRARPAASVRPFAGRPESPAEVGRRLGARYVLAGSVRASARRLRISAEWVRVADGVAVWSERFDEAIDDLFALEERLGERIARALPIAKPGPAATRPPALALPPPSRDIETYLLYLRGRHFANQLTREGYDEAGAAFARAIARDPSYALAWEGLAYRELMGIDLFVPPNVAVESARRAARRALELDPASALASCALIGLAVFCDWDRAAAESGIDAVLAPGEPEVAVARELGWFLTLLGRFDEAIALFDRARERDPVALEQTMYHGAALYLARRYDEARRILAGTLDHWPDYWLAAALLGRCDEAEGDLAGAIGFYEAAVRSARGIAEPAGDLARALALAGRADDARQWLRRLAAPDPDVYVAPHARAQGWFGLGDLDRAFAELEAAFVERSWYLSWIRLMPTMDPYRRDPRFGALVRRVGL